MSSYLSAARHTSLEHTDEVGIRSSRLAFDSLKS